MTDQTPPASELERAYLEPEPFQLQDEVTSLTRDLSASAGLFQRSLDIIGRLQEQLAAKPADDLAQACIAQLIESGAENYTEHHFGFVRDGEDVEHPAVVTVQFSDRPSPHELRMKAEEPLARAQSELAEAVGLLRKANSWISGMRWPGYDLAERHEGLITELEAFLARHAQAEQQEAREPVLAGDEQVAKAIYDADRSLFMTKREYSELNLQTKGRLLKMARAALATQPAAGEPVAYGPSLGQLEREFERYCGSATIQRDASEYYSVPLYAAPPAAAHGDEAVRKDAARYQALRNTPEIFIGVAEGDDMVFLKSPDQLDQLADNAVAMRAQGDGES